MEISSANTLECLINIYGAVRANKFSDELLSEISDDTAYVGSKLNLNPVQCVLLAIILDATYDERSIDSSKIADRMEMNNIEFRRYRKDLEDMSLKHIVRITESSRGKYHTIYSDAIEAIEGDTDYIKPANDNLSIDEVFFRMNNIFSEYRDDALTDDRLFEELHDLIHRNGQLSFCRLTYDIFMRMPSYLKKMYFCMFLYMCVGYVNGKRNCVDTDTLLNFVPEKQDSGSIQRAFRDEKTPLQEKGLIEFCSDDGFVNQDEVCLSERMRSELFTELNIKEKEITKSPDVKGFESITRKELFYNEAEGEQIERLAKLLDDENFKGVQQRLREKGLRDGVNIIMYGKPGTGKTESCLQLARETGRDLFIVDVAKLKSKWVGDSEKQVRGMFVYYRELVKHSEKAPILLLNEADAILGTRIKNVEQSVDKMNNTIQNIILQEMETIGGILIATTNLETNLDPAFERRFLMKIKFDLPDEGARRKIWKNMLPDLEESDASVLAHDYEFSGGQIENVTRKSLINYVIEGKPYNMEDLSKYCEEECFHKSTRRSIGFEF